MSRNKAAPLADLVSSLQEQDPAPEPVKLVEVKPTVDEDDTPVPANKSFKRVGLYLHPAVKREIDTIAFTHERKPHDLYLEAIDLLLKKYGRPKIKALETRSHTTV